MKQNNFKVGILNIVLLGGFIIPLALWWLTWSLIVLFRIQIAELHLFTLVINVLFMIVGVMVSSYFLKREYDTKNIEEILVISVIAYAILRLAADFYSPLLLTIKFGKSLGTLAMAYSSFITGTLILDFIILLASFYLSVRFFLTNTITLKNILISTAVICLAVAGYVIF